MTSDPSRISLDYEAFRTNLPFAVEATNVPGIFSIPNPPPGFDPRTASKHDLIRHGILLRRPDAETEPELRAHWDKFCNEHWAGRIHVNPRLETRSHLRRRSRRKQNSGQAGLDLYQSWAGPISQTPINGGSWSSITGLWEVPTVSLPPGQKPHVLNVCGGDDGGPPQTFSAGPWLSATWIGLGGYHFLVPTASVDQVGSDIIQIGVTHNIDVDGNASYQAFYEWYVDNGQEEPGTMQLVSTEDFPVAPGDVISASVNYIPSQNMGAQVSLYNQKSRKSFSHLIVTPAGSNYTGITAEWVLEATSPIYNQQDDSTFPAFTPVTFACMLSCATDGPAVAANQYLLYQNLGEIQCETLNSCLENNALTQTTFSTSDLVQVTIERTAN